MTWKQTWLIVGLMTLFTAVFLASFSLFTWLAVTYWWPV